jgi:hypothetical protein
VVAGRDGGTTAPENSTYTKIKTLFYQKIRFSL